MHIQSIPMCEYRAVFLLLYHRPNYLPRIQGVGSSNNYAYLVTDEASKDAVIIDPANPPEYALLSLSEFKDLKLPVIGGKDCESVTRTPKHEETFQIGQKISVTALHTPCHTQDSICWLMVDGDEKVVFTGDTLFIGGCGRFFEGTPAEMHTALNKTLAGLPDDTKVYPGHEYTKQNVKFLTTVLQTDPVKKLQSFAENNEQTQGKFTIADEKVRYPLLELFSRYLTGMGLTFDQEYNAFMRVDDPTIQKATGKTDPVEVMAKLREMKNKM
ncbi:MAG: hypothetical protein Q9206_001033 [Seirophora lacunosa]